MNEMLRMMPTHEDLTLAEVAPSECLAIQGGRPGGTGQTFFVFSSSIFAAYQAALADGLGFRVQFDNPIFTEH